MVNTFLRSSSSPGVGRRTKATNFESTLGCGQKMERDTEPAPVTSAHHAAFTLGIPYSFEFGFAASRSATSACTITTPLRSEGNISSKCKKTGTETLYGKFAIKTVGATGRLFSVSAS